MEQEIGRDQDWEDYRKDPDCLSYEIRIWDFKESHTLKSDYGTFVDYELPVHRLDYCQT